MFTGNEYLCSVGRLLLFKIIGMTFENIRLVARYERNLIIRNKLFWIFACCVVAGISLSHWLWQSDSLSGLRWLNRALPSFIPFWNAWFYNLVQGIIVIFIGIDFVWRDRRLETNAVFSARPVTNLAYYTGYGNDAAFVGTGRCYVESEGRGMDIPADRHILRRGLLRYISRDK